MLLNNSEVQLAYFITDVVNFGFAKLPRRNSVVMGTHITGDFMILDHVSLIVWL